MLLLEALLSEAFFDFLLSSFHFFKLLGIVVLGVFTFLVFDLVHLVWVVDFILAVLDSKDIQVATSRFRLEEATGARVGLATFATRFSGVLLGILS